MRHMSYVMYHVPFHSMFCFCLAHLPEPDSDSDDDENEKENTPKRTQSQLPIDVSHLTSLDLIPINTIVDVDRVAAQCETYARAMAMWNGEQRDATGER